MFIKGLPNKLVLTVERCDKIRTEFLCLFLSFKHEKMIEGSS